MAHSQLTLFPRTKKDAVFAQLVGEVHGCVKCARMCGSQRVLSGSAGSLNADVMFIGEAPGRLGADESRIPFHGDQAGHNFESLIEQVGLSRYQLFVTNAVLCNPKDSHGNNATPDNTEVLNCSQFLKRQIDLVQPSIVVPLGATALRALSNIETHRLTLSRDVRTAQTWYGRMLIPAYHPGQRAMVHRSFLNQLSDYQFIREMLVRLGRASTRIYGEVQPRTVAVANTLLSLKSPLSYFALHKLFYLVEVMSLEKRGRRITNAYIVRQKDGPYCVELHLSKLRKQISNLLIERIRGKTTLATPGSNFFDEEKIDGMDLSGEELEIIRQVVFRFGQLDDAELKRRVYLTAPMRTILRKEKTGRVSCFNVPLLKGQ